jgi:hypothetical protein
MIGSLVGQLEGSSYDAVTIGLGEAVAKDETEVMNIAGAFFLVAAGLMAGAASPQGSTRVSGVEVYGGPPPNVVARYPADGGRAPGGVIVLKVVFDQAMTPKAWAYGPVTGAAFPHCLEQPRLLSDGRTYALLCTVEPNQSYALAINPSPAFANAHGRSAKPIGWRFSTSGEVTRYMQVALVQAGLSGVDEPLMSWEDPGEGVSRSQPPSEDAQAAP